LDEFGVVKINKVSLSLVYDDIVGTEISMKNCPLQHQHFMGYRHLSVLKFLTNTRGLTNNKVKKNID
jgi:hypothetical protein